MLSRFFEPFFAFRFGFRRGRKTGQRRARAPEPRAPWAIPISAPARSMYTAQVYPTLALKLSYTTRNVRTRFASSPRPLTPLTLGRAVVRPHTRHALTPSNDRGPGSAPESPSILYTPLPRRSPSLSMPRLRGRRSEPHRRRAPARLAASRRPRSDSQRRRCA